MPALFLLLALLGGCGAPRARPPEEGNAMQGSRVAEVLARHTDRLMAVPGVVGTAEGECGGRPCLLVLVDRRTPALEQAIPIELEGVPVEIRETGPIRALDDSAADR